MILDTMSYSIMAVVVLLSFITVLLARLPEGGQDIPSAHLPSAPDHGSALLDQATPGRHLPPA